MASKKYMRNNISARNFGNVDVVDDLKPIIYPGVIQNMYCISKFGKVYSIVNDSYISWSVRGNLPYVNLTCLRDGRYILEPFYIKDLVACSFLNNSLSYLERGYRVANIDGNPMNCNCQNLVYLK